MHVVRRVASAVRNLVRRRHVERELDAELQSALQLIADEKMAAGMNEGDARRAARIELGGVEQVRTRVRDTRAGAGLDRVWQDLRDAVRWTRRAPGFAATTILILSVGIGAVTAVFAVASAVLFAPPAGVARSDRLVAIDRLNPSRPWGPATISYAEYLEYRQRTDLLDVAASEAHPTVVRIGDRTERIAAELVTANYFDVLGVRFTRGRSFTPDGVADEAIASERFVRTLDVAGDGIGTVVRVSGQPFAIVGIVDEAFRGAEQLERGADLWLPAGARRRLVPYLSPERAKPVTDIEDRAWMTVGRLRDGIDVRAAEASLQATARDLERRHPEALRGMSVALRPGLLLRSRERVQVATAFGLILTAVFLLLLIACANVANLTLARAVGRSKEIAIRLSLGASRWRVFRQLLCESILLAAIASAGGVVAARWMLMALGRAIPPDAGALLLTSVTMTDWRVVLFLFAVTLAVALAAGLVPAWQGTNVAVASAMKQGGPSGPKAARMRVVFVTVQVALAVMLLTGSGLLVRALQAAYAHPLGFETKGLVLASVDPPSVDDPGARDLPLRIDAELARQPDLRRASVSAQAPLVGGGPVVASFTRVPAPEEGDAGAETDVLQNLIGPGYFDALGLAVRAGRGIDGRDRFESEQVVIVNEALAKRRWGNENPVGTQIRLRHERTPRIVVGVVAGAQHIGLAGEWTEALYVPLAQARAWLPRWTILLRPRGDVPSAVRSAQRALDAVDPNLPLYDARPMQSQIAQVVFPQRVMALVTGTFGLFALLLTAAGLAAAVSFVVTQRTPEIGIRMALGAQRSQVIALVMRQGLIVTAVGAVIGLAVSAAGAIVLRSLFDGFRVMDPVVPLIVCTVLAAVALTAGILPARRAARVDPLAALRAE